MTDRELDKNAARRLAIIRHAREVTGNVAVTCAGTAPQAVSADTSDHSTKLGRQAAWVAAETIGDALERWFNLTGGPGYGLYRGSFKVSGGYYSYGPLVLRFKSACFVPNLKVSGTATWNRASSLLTAKLSLTGPHGLKGELRIEWSTSQAGAIAREVGTIGGHSVALPDARPLLCARVSDPTVTPGEVLTLSAYPRGQLNSEQLARSAAARRALAAGTPTGR